MEPFLFYLIRASIIMALFYVFYKLISSGNTFHTANRYSLISIMLMTLFLPPFNFNILPVRETPATDIQLFNLPLFQDSGQLTIDKTGFEIPWIQVLIVLFVIGLILFSVRYLIGINQIIKMISKSEKHSIYDNIRISIADKDISPFSWLNNIVLSRNDFVSSNTDAIIEHEKAHIRLNHSLDMILFDLFTCIFWFNPFAWLLKHEIQTVHEYQADKQVLNNGVNLKQYQLLLIRKSVGEQKFAMANNLRQRSLHKRITMMMKTKSNNRQKWSYAAALPILVLAITALSLPNLNAKQITQKPVIVKNINSNDSTALKIKVYSEKDGNILDGHPIFILDDKRVEKSTIDELSSDDIRAISVLKDKSATSVYGEEAKDGVIIIETIKGEEEKKSKLQIRNETMSEKPPLIVLDGKRMSADFDLNSVNVNDIKSMSILKNEYATEVYGDDGKNGVVIISTTEIQMSEEDKKKFEDESIEDARKVLEYIEKK